MYTVTSAAPQFLVDDLGKSLDHYKNVLGFTVDFVYGDFYAGVSLGGGIVHLKCAPKLVEDRQHRKANEHLDAYFPVTGLEDLYRELMNRGAPILRPLETRPWGNRDFYIEDPDGYILCFAEPV